MFISTVFFLRILSSLERFQGRVVLPPNITKAKLYVRETFALQAHDIDIESFSGEVFNADVGSFEEALKINNSIPEKALQTTLEVLSNATASISIPPNFFSSHQREESKRARLCYSVFLKDTLFFSPNQTSGNLSIGTIIAAVWLQYDTVSQTQIPFKITFRIDKVMIKFVGIQN